MKKNDVTTTWVIKFFQLKLLFYKIITDEKMTGEIKLKQKKKIIDEK